MEIFNENTAALLQYFTFPLEFIGITLALIEVRFQALTLRLNAMLKQSYNMIKASEDRFYARHPWLKRLNDKIGTDLPAPDGSRLFSLV